MDVFLELIQCRGASLSNFLSQGNRVSTIKLHKFTNLLSWTMQTVRVDRKNYKHQLRPISLKRLTSMLAPNLHQPIFIVGAPRSGTTFLGACIADLPEISYHFEPVATKAAARYVHEHIWDFKKAHKFYYSVYAWLMRLHFDADLRFAEKTPRNCFLINFLYRIFPDAQFIHIIRDGRDAALSHSQKPWLQAASAQSGKRESSGYRHGPYARFWVEPERTDEFESTSDIHRCIWAWRRHTESILAQAQHLPKSQYYELRYEAFVTRPHEEADRLLNYLNIVQLGSRECLHKAFAHANCQSVGRWKDALTPEQVKQIEQEAGPMLRTLGYLQGS